jgi:hypothetical protein
MNASIEKTKQIKRNENSVETPIESESERLSTDNFHLDGLNIQASK